MISIDLGKGTVTLDAAGGQSTYALGSPEGRTPVTNGRMSSILRS